MAFANFEATVSDGYPVELFHFHAEAVDYRYCSHDEDVVSGSGHTWIASNFGRNRFALGTELERAALNLQVNLDLPLMTLFEDGVPESAVQLKAYRMHLTDPELEEHLFWEGEITTVRRSDKQAQLMGEVPEITLRSAGLRRRYQRSCPYPLYGAGCNIAKESFQTAATIISVANGGLIIRVNVADTAPFRGGFLSSVIGGHTKLRYIANGIGDALYLTRTTSWANTGVQLLMYPGCPRTWEGCTGLFNNGDNFGGMKDMPITDPFNTQVY